MRLWHDVALLIASCDRNRGVLAQTAEAFRRRWPDCPFPRYVGINNPVAAPPGFKALAAPAKGWRAELRAQVASLPARRVLLFLDDFLLLRPVDTTRVLCLAERALCENWAYLRLVPPSGALAVVALRRLAARFKGADVCVIPGHLPYPSALQVAIWDRDYLLEQLGGSGSIWDFEHQAARRPHLAVTRPALCYLHLVERGMWLPHAPRLLRQANGRFDAAGRPVLGPGARLRRWGRKARFALLGYSVMRARRMVLRGSAARSTWGRNRCFRW